MWRKVFVPLWLKRRAPDMALDQVLRFAVDHVPYYRPFRDYQRLEDFPFLTKDIIRANPKDLLSDDIDSRQWFYDTSGGSTGEPVRFAQDEQYVERINWARWETKRWAGCRPGDRLLKFWGARGDNPVSRGLKERCARWLSNIVVLDTFLLSDELIRQYMQVLREFRPQLIVGYASSLYEISRYVLAREVEIHGVRAIVSAAGTLYPEMRRAMEEAFHCRVFNRYGSREVGAIAAEDGRGLGLQVCPTVHVEVVRPDGAPCPEGEMGEIVVTSLANLAMPLIRFRIGDVGILRTHGSDKYLEKVVGRTVELFRTKDGKRIDGEYFTHLLYFKDWVRHFRFRQVAYDRIVVEVVRAPSAEPPRSELAEVEGKTREIMGEDVRIDWEFVDAIAPLPSGKYIYTVCEVG